MNFRKALGDLGQHTTYLSNLCDFTIKIKERQIAVHSVVASAISETLYRILKNYFYDETRCSHNNTHIEIDAFSKEELLYLVYPDKRSLSTQALVENKQTLLRIETSELLTIMKRMNNMRKQEDFCDVTLKVENQEFAAHRFVLCSRCSFFRSLFTTDMRERNQNIVKLDVFENSVMEDVLEYIYTGQTELTPDKALFLLKAGDYLLLDELKTKCADYLCTAVSVENVVQVYQLGKRHGCANLAKAAAVFIENNFDKISNHVTFPGLTSSELEEFLSSDELGIAEEEIAYTALVCWTKYNVRERFHLFGSLFEKHIRLSFVNKQFVHNVILKEPLVMSNEACSSSITKCMSLGHATSQTPRRGYAQHYIAFMSWTANNTKGLYFFDSAKSSYLVFASLPGKFSKTAPANLVCCDGYIFAIGNNFGFRYDVLINKWCAITPLPAFKTNTTSHGSLPCFGSQGVAALGGFLYVTTVNRDKPHSQEISEKTHPSGCTWRYNNKTNTWDIVASLEYPRESLCLLTCGNFLYAIGGSGTCPDSYLSEKVVERYDPRQDCWVTVSPLKVGSVSPRGVAVRDKIFVMDQLGLFQMYNTLLDKWLILPSPKIER